ncbi:MAG: FAD-dependent oxidoreductase [Candidatus Aminicenantes bacterium]
MKIGLTVDGQPIEARQSQTVLAAALTAGIYIPHLCYHPDLPSFQEASPSEVCYRGQQEYHSDSQSPGYQGCGLCVVDVKRQKEPVLSCITEVEEGMEVLTSTPALSDLRQEKLVSILTPHPHACLTCAQREGCSLTQCSTNVPEEERCCPQFDFCELRRVSEYIGIREDISRYVPGRLYCEEDKPLFLRDYNLCVGCLRCVRVCSQVIGAKALSYVVSGGEIMVGTARPTLQESGCLFCGACVEVCPTGALRDKEIKPGEKQKALIPCAAQCPLGMDVPSYVNHVSRGRYKEAADLIRERTPLALTLGYICHHPCEEECRRGRLNQAVAICDIKRFALERGEASTPPQRKDSTGKKVAVVGSGPAGLVASYFLSRMGHSVRVYEAQPEPGGMLRWAVPEFRLPRSVIQAEIEEIEAAGVEILTQTPVDGNNLFKEFDQGRWDALFLAAGAQHSKRIEVEGLAGEGIHWGLEFLKETKQGKRKKLEGRVVVVGGGNVALDVAMSALRLGASRVELACLEKREDMPAFAWEIQEAEEEGVIIHPGWGPEKFHNDGSRLHKVQFHRCTSVFDAKGNFDPRFDPSEKKSLEAETVILAVGQQVDLSFLPSELEIHTTQERTVEVHPQTFQTNLPGIFAGGEVASGPASAVEAMASGRKAASAIDRFLGGEGLKDDPYESRRVKRESLWIGQQENFYAREKVSMTTLSLARRLRSFELIQKGYGEAEARREADRCLRCDLRFQFSPVIIPPEKWIEFTEERVGQVPESEGVFQLLDGEKNIIYIAGTANLKQTLRDQLASNPKARYFFYQQDPMYTKKESELIQQFLQKHGHLPPGNEEVDDLF